MALVNTEPTYPDRRPAPSGRISYEDFLAWTDDKTFAEWVDGEVQIMSPVADAHQDLAGFLYSLIRWYAEELGTGRVFGAPFQMKMQSLERGREPDIMFVKNENLGRVTKTFLKGPADLAVEIVSPESLLRDRGEKYAEYEMEGVGEYWILDPETMRADFFLLGTDGRYERSHPDENHIYHSTVLAGLWVNSEWFWRNPLPRLRDIQQQWALQEGDNS